MLVSYDLRLTVGGIPQKQGLGCSGSSRGHLSVLFLYHYPKPLNYGHPSLCISLKKRMWSFVLPRTMPIGHPKRLILYSLPYGLGHPFLNSYAKVNRIGEICKWLKEKVPPIEGSTFIFNKIQNRILFICQVFWMVINIVQTKFKNVFIYNLLNLNRQH